MYYLAEESLAQYIRITLPCSPRAKTLLYNMQVCVKTLNGISDEIDVKIKNLKESIFNAIGTYPSKHARSKYINEVSFVIQKFFNLFLKYHSLRFSYYNRINQTIKEFKKLISEYLKQNVPIQIDFSRFRRSIIEKVDQSIPKLEFKLKSLFNYVRNLPNIEKNPLITTQELLTEIKKQINENDISNHYIQPNNFDLIFESYIELNSELLKDFLEIININNNDTKISSQKSFNDCNFQIKNIYEFNLNDKNSENLILNDFYFFIYMLNYKTKTKNDKNTQNSIELNSINDKINENDEPKLERIQKGFDFKNFNFLVQKLFQSLNQTDPKIFVVLHCSSLRFLCNKIYINHSKEWHEKLNEKYIQNCEKILKMTPSELKISTDIFPSNLYDTSFELLLLNEGFQNSINHMFSIQFLTCPIDIWSEMKIAIDLTMKSVGEFNVIEVNKTNISFDDFFSIVLPVFASSQIMAVDSLHSFLSAFKGMPKSNSFDVAAALCVALSDFIKCDMNL